MRGTRVAAAGLAVVFAVACGHKAASIDVSPKRVRIYGLERSQRLTGRVLDRKGQPLDASPEWSSSNAEIVQAEPGGRLVAKKAGKATVTAAYEGVTAEVPVEVFDVSSLETTPASVPLIGPVGTSVPLTCTLRDSGQRVIENLKPTWTSSNPKVATVSDDGVVTSVAPGTATILTKVGDLQGISEVTVRVLPIARLELRPETALIRVGDSQHYQVTAYGPDGQPIPGVAAAYSSSSPAVATIDSAGVASGRSAGAATIRVELAGAFAQATLLVN
jgi:uncharacterized protein YjdB